MARWDIMDGHWATGMRDELGELATPQPGSQRTRSRGGSEGRDGRDEEG